METEQIIFREVLQSKIHKATVTGADLHYVGSITIDSSLLERIDLWPGQKVVVVSNTNGARIETYVIAGRPNSGEICVNGAAAHQIQKGHEVIIFSYGITAKPIKAKCILVDSHNKYLQDL